MNNKIRSNSVVFIYEQYIAKNVIVNVFFVKKNKISSVKFQNTHIDIKIY